jgi:hypothetical protein
MIRALPALAALAVLAVAALAPAGCASRPESAAAAVTVDAPLLVTGREFPAEGSIAADEAFPLGLAEIEWLAAPAPATRRSEAKAVRVTTSASTDHGGAIAREIPGESTEFLSAGPEGVDLHAVLSPGDAALSRFATPLRLLPSSLAAGADSSNLRRRKDRGTGERVARYARDVEVTVGGRTYRAQVLESSFTALLGSAKATRTTELLVVPGLGPVAERWTREVVVLGLVRTVREGVRVRDLDPGP